MSKVAAARPLRKLGIISRPAAKHQAAFRLAAKAISEGQRLLVPCPHPLGRISVRTRERGVGAGGRFYPSPRVKLQLRANARTQTQRARPNALPSSAFCCTQQARHPRTTALTVLVISGVELVIPPPRSISSDAMRALPKEKKIRSTLHQH